MAGDLLNRVSSSFGIGVGYEGGASGTVLTGEAADVSN